MAASCPKHPSAFGRVRSICYNDCSNSNCCRNSVRPTWGGHNLQAQNSLLAEKPTMNSNWIDSLEKDFDKAFVDLDILLGEIDVDQADLIFDGRQKMTALSAAFAQLSHKAQTLMGSNSRLQTELQMLRHELCSAQANLLAQRNESQRLMITIHALQCQLFAKTAPHESDMILKKLERETDALRSELLPVTRLQAETTFLKKENVLLRKFVNALQNEAYGSRLAARYLDRELAGRIQQIQLLGKDMKGPQHQRLWNQLEAEISLYRHKTVVRACRGRPSSAASPVARDARPLRDLDAQGGQEHGVPILISEVHLGKVAHGKLQVGDAIMKVNGVDLSHANHSHAVDLLAKQGTDVVLEILSLSDDDSDDECRTIIQVDDKTWLDLYESSPCRSLLTEGRSRESCSSSNASRNDASDL